MYHRVSLTQSLFHSWPFPFMKVLQGVDAMIWCATGFSNKPNANPLEKAKGFLDLALKRTIDVIALPTMAKQIKMYNQEQSNNKNTALPKVVMLSSAGVTRTIWDEKKKDLMPGAADIPIVRLNPFGALDVKRESEEKLRATGEWTSGLDSVCQSRLTGRVISTLLSCTYIFTCRA